jgi:hypothetical protein
MSRFLWHFKHLVFGGKGQWERKIAPLIFGASAFYFGPNPRPEAKMRLAHKQRTHPAHARWGAHIRVFDYGGRARTPRYTAQRGLTCAPLFSIISIQMRSIHVNFFSAASAPLLQQASPGAQLKKTRGRRTGRSWMCAPRRRARQGFFSLPVGNFELRL